VIGQKKKIRLGAQQKVAIHKIHPQDERLTVLLESRQELAVDLEGRGAV
jgi:predicted SPOUT superfamily RNA methylase MTH1